MLELVRPLCGEPLGLDLVNTAWPEGSESRDVLSTPGGHAGWLAERGLKAPTTHAARRALIETRAALRALLEHPGDPASVAAVDAVLARGRLRIRAGAIRESADVAATWLVPWLAARDLLETLDAHPARVRRCANPECVLWFLDTTRSSTRRWCSMAGCGNRAKARRHYERSQCD